jgi:hypothetical protein
MADEEKFMLNISFVVKTELGFNACLSKPQFLYLKMGCTVKGLG